MSSPEPVPPLRLWGGRGAARPTPGSNRWRHPKWGPGDRYKADTYAKAIGYACKQAFPAPEGVEGKDLTAWHRAYRWMPNQLRHSFATKVRHAHGLESSQVLLGHARADVTQVYAEVNEKKAVEITRKIG